MTKQALVRVSEVEMEIPVLLQKISGPHYIVVDWRFISYFNTAYGM